MQSKSSFEIRKANTNQLFSQLVKDIESKTGDEQNWKDRLQHVISLYEGCINVAQTNHEKSMIHKNLIKVYRFCCMTYAEPEAKLLYFDEMISNASQAIYRGTDTQKREWTTAIIEQGEAWDALLQQILEEQTCEYRADYYEKVFLRCNKQSVCLLFMLAHRLAEAYFKSSVKLSEDQKKRKANQMIQKAVQYNNYRVQTHQVYGKTFKQIEDFWQKEQVTNLDEDIQKQALLCAANIEFRKGRQWLAKVFETENFEVGIVHDALDCFNSASKIAQGKDFETEAIAEALAGQVHFQFLKNLPKAKDRLYNAMRLSNMMTDTNVQEKKWYQLASKWYQEVRDQLAREGSKIKDEERQKILDEIKGEVKVIEAARKKGTKPFLEFLNEKYLKPADKEVPLGEEALKESKIKSTILKFTREFHPDKQVNKPRKYQVLYEEITKNINDVYALYK